MRKILSVTAMLLLAASAFGQQVSMSFEPDTDRPGANLRVLDLDEHDPRLCAEMCQAEPQCCAYTYVKPGVQGRKARCWLKSEVVPAKPDTCCASGVKTVQRGGTSPTRVSVVEGHPMAVGPMTFEHDTDRPGANLQSFDLDRPDPRFCSQACLEDPGCRAYTYVKPGVQGSLARCWLKSEAVPAKPDTCCVSGVKTVHGGDAPATRVSVVEGHPMAVGPMTFEHDTDRPGANLRSLDLNRPDPRLCSQACLEDPQCRAYTYVKPGVQGSLARCWLKSEAVPANPNACCVSGVKLAPDDASHMEIEKPDTEAMPINLPSTGDPRGKEPKR